MIKIPAFAAIAIIIYMYNKETLSRSVSCCLREQETLFAGKMDDSPIHMGG